MLINMAADSSDYGFCEIFLFKDIKNGKEIHSHILEGSLKCAAIKPALIAHPLQIAVACKKSLAASVAISTNEAKSKGLMTKSIFTEILYNLAPTKNIAESLKTYGVSNNDHEIIFVLIKEQNQEYSSSQDELLSKVDGKLVSNLMDDKEGLPCFTNWNSIVKLHKLKSITDKKCIVDVLVSRAATKDSS